MALKVIAFDADDTLWVNEPFFRETEEKLFALMQDYLPLHAVTKELYATEMQNLSLYGYGIKGFMLSMIETAIRISKGTVHLSVIDKIIGLGKDMMEKPVDLLDDVEQVLHSLQPHYKLVAATKGDLLDQERKLKKSGLESYFHHIEIMSDKQEADYKKLMRHLDIQPHEFMMIGNSLKSDILPVLALGGKAIHIPFHITWHHEHIAHSVVHENFREVKSMKEILPLLLPKEKEQ